MHWNLDLDTTAHIAELLAAVVTIIGFFAAILPVVWKVNRFITKLMDMLADFPLHRHVNGRIIFPKDYEPAQSVGMQPVKGDAHQ